MLEADHETCTADDGSGHLGLVHYDGRDGVPWAVVGWHGGAVQCSALKDSPASSQLLSSSNGFVVTTQKHM